MSKTNDGKIEWIHHKINEMSNFGLVSLVLLIFAWITRCPAPASSECFLALSIFDIDNPGIMD